MSMPVKLGLLASWVAGVYGSLRIHELDLGLTHGICGPWGCGPRVEALVGFHGFWLMLLVPSALVFASYVPRRWACRTGIALTCVGFIATVGFVIWDVATYLHAAPSSGDSYWFRRGLFALATLVEVPLVPTTLAGLILWKVSRKPQADEVLGEPASFAETADHESDPFGTAT